MTSYNNLYESLDRKLKKNKSIKFKKFKTKNFT